jgi:hypothetical protein
MNTNHGRLCEPDLAHGTPPMQPGHDSKNSIIRTRAGLASALAVEAIESAPTRGDVPATSRLGIA